ncbi:MAG: hypothetical protein J6J87_07495 [Oscillospiraceae bacterium]|nr:hypothetical protein [Oscillospiraceae bacterium]
MADQNNQEKYEDALLAQMVQEALADEGDRLREENERLLQDPNAAVPVDISKRCIRAIRRSPYQNMLRKLGTALAVLLRRTVPLLLLAGLIWWAVHRFGM